MSNATASHYRKMEAACTAEEVAIIATRKGADSHGKQIRGEGHADMQ